MSYTPGPWIAEDIPSGGWKIKAVIARVPDKLRGILEISAPRYTSFTVGEDGKLWATIAYEEYVQFPPDDIKEQWAANAKLAAAAPDLLVVAKMFLETMRQDAAPEGSAQMVMTKAAIEKAGVKA